MIKAFYLKRLRHEQSRSPLQTSPHLGGVGGKGYAVLAHEGSASLL